MVTRDMSLKSEIYYMMAYNKNNRGYDFIDYRDFVMVMKLSNRILI